MVTFKRILTRAAGALGAAALLATPGAFAADFPGGKPVHIIAATGPGSATDLTARQIAAGLSKEWGSPFIVENKTGAGGTIAGQYVAKAAPDGHTLLSTYAQHNTNQLVRDMSLPLNDVVLGSG